MSVTSRRKESQDNDPCVPLKNGNQSLEKQKAALLSNHQHFSMVRNFYPADFLTLMNGACGVASVFSCLKYLADPSKGLKELWLAFLFIPFGCFFDVLDGRVARWRNESSVLGQELDSLADLVSFGVAPACIGYVVGLRSFLDQVALIYFVACGIARLARYNATVALLPKDAKGKVEYFEGTPIPTSLGVLAVLAYFLYSAPSFTSFSESLSVGFSGTFFEFHYLVLLYVMSGSCMISRSLRIPKL
ncbi:CDP-diacylglycerol-serine O-phosphatidyltransferase [Entomophthora muscae]|uniref:CDP-diacylglycerol-serine O-phosphatidyltransferase n=2 Tax=Entomophthora muscae TaxID=34485 RepID=A0ACC2SRS3_9FUNG|nr:CDP-diacylglycerol-serine O-phosphatidyltransferase [Entomophthora muscae]KAJ9065078.1 CDP-diacylglycerol-serine O-phosphatidyltransferase [Entomophthora muscae]